jgi:hypothetical protein
LIVTSHTIDRFSVEEKWKRWDTSVIKSEMLVFELTGTLSSPKKISQTLVYKKLLIIYCNNNSYVKLISW